MTLTEEKNVVIDAANLFPEEFGLRAFTGDVFSVSLSTLLLGALWIFCAKVSIALLEWGLISFLPSLR